MQQFGEKDLGRGPELEALSRGVVVCRDASLEAIVVDGVEVCLSGQEPAQSADGVLHGALLPRTVRVAKEGPDAELIGKGKVLGELGAVVEGNGPPQTPIERLEPGLELLDGGLRGLAELPGSRMRRDLRSCATREAWPGAAKSMRSASQCPKVRRLSTAVGRKAMETRPLMRSSEERLRRLCQPRLYLALGR